VDVLVWACSVEGCAVGVEKSSHSVKVSPGTLVRIPEINRQLSRFDFETYRNIDVPKNHFCEK
jgi:hypothetical protein